MDQKVIERYVDKKAARLLKRKNILRRYKKYWFLYALLFPAVVILFIYAYIPMILQVVMSFTEYTFDGGIFGSTWVGMKNFVDLFNYDGIGRIIKNTIEISFLRFIFGFFPPLILSIFLFDLHSRIFRKISQTIVYIPYFFSWVIIYSISWGLFSYEGIVNSVITLFGGSAKNLLEDADLIRPILIGTSVWKNMGWGTIIYLAAMTSIDTQLYDAAKIDGCGPVRRIFAVTIPGITHIISFLLIMAIGNLLRNVDSEQILLFYSPLTYEKADVIDTWIYRIGYGGMEFSLGATLSFLQSTISMGMILLANYICSKTAKVSLW